MTLHGERVHTEEPTLRNADETNGLSTGNAMRHPYDVIILWRARSNANRNRRTRSFLYFRTTSLANASPYRLLLRKPHDREVAGKGSSVKHSKVAILVLLWTAVALARIPIPVLCGETHGCDDTACSPMSDDACKAVCNLAKAQEAPNEPARTVAPVFHAEAAEMLPARLLSPITRAPLHSRVPFDEVPALPPARQTDVTRAPPAVC